MWAGPGPMPLIAALFPLFVPCSPPMQASPRFHTVQLTPTHHSLLWVYWIVCERSPTTRLWRRCAQTQGRPGRRGRSEQWAGALQWEGRLVGKHAAVVSLCQQ